MKPEGAFILDHAAWPAFLVDDSGTVRRANPAAVAALGAVMEGEPTLGASIWDPESEMPVEAFLSRRDRSSSFMTVMRFRAKGGVLTTYSTHVCAVPRDGKKWHLFQLLGEPGPAAAAPAAVPSGSIEAGAAQKQKLDCAMQLIRTVALDFNNALTTILGHTSLVLSRLEPTHPWRSSLVQVEKSAERAAEIAQDLADFSRQEKDPRTRTAGSLNAVARHAVELFQKPGLSHILWNLQLEKRPFTVEFDEAKMLQAVVRLLENSIEALGPQGRILIRTLNHSLTEPQVSSSFALAPGHYVCLEVSDNGCGIPAETLPRIFEPFFTTKQDGRHRGLGLAWVYGIVTNHGGVVDVQSTPGQGTTVRLHLPAQEKVVRDHGTKVEDLRGHQTILFVDDEEMLLNLGQTVLSAFGYKVLTASSGAKALELFAQARGQIGLVVTDLVMPGMSGRELMEQLRRIAPRVPILCTSGYLRTPAEGEEENYLRKPFTSQELLRKVKRVLTPADPGGA